MRISLCARSRLLLLDRAKSFRIEVLQCKAGAHLNLHTNVTKAEGDVTIFHHPLILIHVTSIETLGDQVIDFDYNQGIFLISNRGNE